MQIVPRRPQPIVRIGPLRPEPRSRLELLNCRLCFTFVLQGERKIIVRIGVIGFDRECLSVVLNGLVPRFAARKLNRLFAVALGGLRENGRGEKEAQDQQKQHKGRCETNPILQPIRVDYRAM